MSAITRAIKGNVSAKAKKLVIILCGLKAIGQKLPAPEDLPSFSDDVWVEISDAGFILGSPERYKLNEKKFNVKSGADSSPSKAPPAVLTLLKHYKALHERFKRGKLGSSERDLVQIRYLIRNFDPHRIEPLMEQYFREPLIKARKGRLTLQDFFLWAKRKLSK